MPRRIPVSIAESAIKDFREIRRYYANQDAVQVGNDLIAKILLRIEALSEFPDMGRVVPEFRIKNLRELIVPPFRIVYRRDKTRVRVVRVWRSERLLKLPASRENPCSD